MKTFPSALAVLCLLGSAALFAEDAEREIRGSFATRPGQAVRIDFNVGELQVEAAGGGQVRVELTARCRVDTARCRRRLADVELVERAGSGQLHIEIAGPKLRKRSDLRLEGRVFVPRGRALEVEMGVGELEVTGFEADVRVRLGVGEARIELPNQQVGSVTGQVGVGEATLDVQGQRLDGRRRRLVGSRIEWDGGQGSAQVQARVGVGSLVVDLE